jgi:hypothetical protein
MCYGHATDCVCPVAFSGTREKSRHYHEYDFTQVNEPLDRVQHEDVAPNYSSQQYLEIPRSLPEGAEIVVPKRFSKVFTSKQKESVHHFAGIANLQFIIN